MLFSVFQLGVLFLFSLGILFLIKKNNLRRILSLLFSIFFSLQCLSLYYGNNLIDAKFYKHFNFRDIKLSISFFWLQAILFFLLVILVFILYLYGFNKFSKRVKRSILFGFLILSTVLMSLSGGVFNSLYNILHLNSVKDLSLEKALLNLDIKPEDYVFSDAIEASKGKNIIVISLESYEKGYLQDNFKHLTPNLREFREQYQYFDMNQGFGSRWTTASMYTYLTGVPMFLKGANNALEKTVDSKLTGIGSILNEAGYNQLYLLGNPDFSGGGDLIKANKINFLPQSYFDKKYGKSPLGLHDYDLFSEAKEQIKEFKSKGNPFALYMSTISTHFPNGVYDNRMESIIPKKKSDIEFMVASVDYMLKDFIDFLQQQGELKDTVFYIFPDHLLMGSGSGVKNLFKERELFLITNARKENLNFLNKDKPIEQIDLAKIIIDGAEIKHNAKFLTDYIKGDKAKYLEDNVEQILALNEASLRIDAFNSDFKIKLKSFSKSLKSNIFTLESKKNKLKFRTDNFAIKDNRYHAFVFDSYMKVNHLTSNDKNFIYKNFNNNINVLIDIKDSLVMNVFLRKGNTVGKVNQYNTDEIKIFNDDIENLKLIEDYDFNKINKLESSYFRINSPEGILYITSSPNSFSESIPTYLAFNNKVLNYNSGLNLISLDKPSEVENYDIYNKNDEIKRFVSRVNNLVTEGARFVIVSHEPDKIESDSDKNLLAERGLIKLSYINKKRSYVCYFEDGAFLEKIDKSAISIQVELGSNNENNENIKSNPKRFIAHAGGKIKNKTYTNSLEALNENYKKGFRYFELDIIKTSDNIFVAAHDWKGWKKKHGFSKDKPISLKIFMNTKVFNQFTPLSIKEINTWFKNHPDAFLVTDKVNTPKEFSNAFSYKNRLIMELFNSDAVKEANKLNIKFLAAPSVFKGMNKKQKLNFIKQNNVKYMSISRKSIINNRAFYKQLKDLGVKVFAYHISFGKWSNEQYVFINELDYIYGIYADDWIF